MLVVNTPSRSGRGRTRTWFAFYTLALLGIAIVCIVTSQWSVAVTTLAIAAIFVLYTRRLWRRR